MVKRDITSIGVDLNGDLILPGAMTYPADPARYFRPSSTPLLRVSRPGMSVTTCEASRDPSGYFRSETSGPEVHLPEAFAIIIKRALFVGARSPIDCEIVHQDGTLYDAVAHLSKHSQPLSSWKLDIDDREGTIFVRLSALLHAQNIRQWLTSEANYWNGAGERIDIQFEVDPLTRIACFGAIVLSLVSTDAVSAPLPLPSTLVSLNIYNACVGQYGQYAIDGDRWIQLYESGWQGASIASERISPARDAYGLISGDAGSRNPSIWLRGVKTEFIANILAESNNTKVVFDGNIGTINYSYGSDGGESHEITRLSLEATISDAGLRVYYSLQAVSEEREIGMNFNWETLILRFPVFAQTARQLRLSVGEPSKGSVPNCRPPAG